jgi:UDP-N-acetylglucosamine 2-epimerase
VEAGLRSFRKDMPEEVNRVITDHLSTLLFCPTLNAVTNLKREGITSGVYNVGDIMYESLGHYLGLAEKGAGVLDALGLEKKGYYLATVHRAENTDSPKRLRRIIAMLSGLGFPIIFPLHPRTKKALKNFSISLPIYSRIRFIRPVGYFDMLLLQKHARAVITDSGGVQKESYFLDTPCITLRRETECIETLQGNGNTLVDVDRKAFMRAVKRYAGLKLKNNKAAFAKRGISGRIIGILEKELNG